MKLRIHITAQGASAGAAAPLRSFKSLLPALLRPGVPGSGVGVLVSFEVTEAGVATCSRGQASTWQPSAAGRPQPGPQSQAVGRCTGSTPLCRAHLDAILCHTHSYKLTTT